MQSCREGWNGDTRGRYRRMEVVLEIEGGPNIKPAEEKNKRKNDVMVKS